MIKKHLRKIGIYSFEKAKKIETDSGIIEERRKLLWLPVVAASAFLLPKQILSKEKPNSLISEGLDWQDFLKQVSPNAKELHKDSSSKGQDAYLFWLASMAARLKFSSIPKGKLRSFANLNPPVETGLAHRGIPFFIIEWKMSPNAYLPAHNHPNISVCTLCIEGEARLRNFNPHGETEILIEKGI